MFSKNHPIILFIDRSGFSLFQDTQSNIPKFNFTPDVVVNLDVVNKEQFTNLLATFIQINKIVPSSLAVILSDTVIYEKDLSIPPPTVVNPALPKPALPEQSVPEENIQNFLDNVPFEDVLAKVIKSENTNRVVAVNKDLVETIVSVFVSRGSIIEAVVPSFLYGQSANFTQGLTQENIRIILERAEIIKIGNLLTDQQKVSPPPGLEIEVKSKEKKPKSIRQFILIGVFAALLIILAVVYFTMGISQAPPVSKTKNSVSAGSVPTVIPTLVQESITPSPIDLTSIRIKIVQNSPSDVVANNLKNELLRIGFLNVANEVATSAVSEKSSVLFSQDISPDVRNNVIIEIKKVLPEISILESQDSNLTITILMGKS